MKCLPIRLRNFLPISVSTAELNGGLNQIILRVLVLPFYVILSNVICLAQAIVYKASVTTPTHKTPKVYFGATELPFKFRSRNHKQSFNNPNRRNDTQLAKHIWELKEKGSDFQIKWEVQRQCSPYQCGSRRCDLCLSEKYVILLHNDRDLLNKRSELMSSCRHRAKFKMKTL